MRQRISTGPQIATSREEKARQHPWPFRAMEPVNGPVTVASVVRMTGRWRTSLGDPELTAR